jgi:hypothetical protein
MPNSRDRYVRTSFAVAPPRCASTAVKTASRSATVGACLRRRAVGAPTGYWRSACRASPSSPFDCSGCSSEFRQHAFCDLKLIELVRQLCPFGIEPGELFGNSLPLPFNLVRCRHMYFPSVPRPIMTRQRDHSATIRGLTHADTYIGEGSERDAGITLRAAFFGEKSAITAAARSVYLAYSIGLPPFSTARRNETRSQDHLPSIVVSRVLTSLT